MHFKISSAISFNLDQSKILSSGNGFNRSKSKLFSTELCPKYAFFDHLVPNTNYNTSKRQQKVRISQAHGLTWSVTKVVTIAHRQTNHVGKVKNTNGLVIRNHAP